MLACQQFISATLGDEYGTPITDQIADLYEETRPDRPVFDENKIRKLLRGYQKKFAAKKLVGAVGVMRADLPSTIPLLRTHLALERVGAHCHQSPVDGCRNTRRSVCFGAYHWHTAG